MELLTTKYGGEVFRNSSLNNITPGVIIQQEAAATECYSRTSKAKTKLTPETKCKVRPILTILNCAVLRKTLGKPPS